jgi:siroheme synthase-like protein
MSSKSLDNLRFLPVGLSVAGRDCLVVGGGSVGERKAQNLLRAGASVRVVAPSVTTALSDLVDQGRVRWVESPFREEQLGGAFLVVAATDDEALNASIVGRAARAGLLTCDASSAERSQVIFGALLDVEDATVAVFTDGHDPARARRMRDRIGNALSNSTDGAPQD